MFTVYVDADACPVVRIIEDVALEMHVPVELICDTNHVLFSDYSRVRVIGAGADAVDFVLINLLKAGDVVVTQDYGVAALALGKKAHAIHQSGKIFSDLMNPILPTSYLLFFKITMMIIATAARSRTTNRRIQVKAPLLVFTGAGSSSPPSRTLSRPSPAP